MPNNLSPELLALLKAGYTPGQLQGAIQSQGGMSYAPTTSNGYSGGGGAEGGDWQAPSLNGFIGYDPNHVAVGDTYSGYGNDGAWQQDAQIKPDNSLKEALMALAIFGTAGAGWGTALGGMGMGGAGAAAGGMAGDAAFAGTLAEGGMGGLTAGELGGGALGGGYGTMGSLPLMEGGAQAALPEFSYGGGALGSGAMAAPALSGSGGAAAAGYGTMDALPLMSSAAQQTLPLYGAASSGLSSLLGPAATLLGGLSGAKGQNNTTTTQNKMDPRMDPYIYGDANGQGLLQMVQDQLHKDHQPGAMQGYDDMKRVGQGLLNRPVSGNAFSRFFPGK